MGMRLSGVSIVAMLLLGASVPTFAHHSFSVEFDATKCQDFTGTLTGVDWENPHAYVRLDVKDASGKMVPWRLEMITPNALRRNGTERQVFLDNVGKTMYARGCLAREGAGTHRGAAEYIKLGDGLIRIVGQVVERDLTPEKLSFWGK